jgi:NDP-sugar pyrophosphorylase family protein
MGRPKNMQAKNTSSSHAHPLRKAVILAGGEGTRLRPLTLEVPKPLIPLHDRPLIEHLFDLFKRHHIYDIIISVGYKKEKVKEVLGDGLRFGVRLIYLEEDEPLGTAGPLKQGARLFPSTFCVTNGDELKDINIEDMYAQHRATRAWATIALLAVPDPGNYGVAELEGQRITRFVEKPPKGLEPSNYINSGFYILEPDIIPLIPQGKSMLEKDIFPLLARQGKLYGYFFSGQWYDTGTMERYERAIREWKDIKIEVAP